MENELATALAQVLSAAVWPVTVMCVVLIFRKPAEKLITRISSADQLSVSLGKLTMEAKAMRELQNTITEGFTGDSLDKENLNSYLNMRLDAIRASIERGVSGADLRREHRFESVGGIQIRTGKGKVFDGKTLNLSRSGIGFISDTRIALFDVVELFAVDRGAEHSAMIPSPVRILRIESVNGEYHYGARVVEETE